MADVFSAKGVISICRELWKAEHPARKIERTPVHARSAIPVNGLLFFMIHLPRLFPGPPGMSIRGKPQYSRNLSQIRLQTQISSGLFPVRIIWCARASGNEGTRWSDQGRGHDPTPLRVVQDSCQPSRAAALESKAKSLQQLRGCSRGCGCQSGQR